MIPPSSSLIAPSGLITGRASAGALDPQQADGLVDLDFGDGGGIRGHVLVAAKPIPRS
jgi:hypothetical protein